VLRDDLSPFSQVAFQRLNFRASNRFGRIIREQTELPVRVKMCGIDVLWSPGYTAPFFSCCPQVTSILDMQYKSYPEDLSMIARMMTDILVNAAAKRSRRILTISEFSKKEIVKHTSALPDKIVSVLLAAAPALKRLARKDNEQDPAPPAIAGKSPYILCVANTYPHKRVHLLVEAFADILEEIKHNLVLVGLPRLGEEKVKKALDRVPENGRVLRLSRLSADELAAVYRGADLFVFPSFYEGFGLPVLEAMMAGIPVITTKKGSIPEVGGHHVVYADPPATKTIAEHILKVLGWTQRQRRVWVQQAATHASAFTWEKTARKTMAVLERAAMRNSGVN